MSREKFLILDANSIINRAFYGVRLLTTKDGTYTNAVYGFLNIMFKYIEEINPSYIAAAFDLKAPTFRHKMYDGYKATRKGMPEELAVQVPLLKEVLSAMNITVLEKEGYEADDIIGTVARKCSEKGFECDILTGDKDDLQLATETNKIYLVTTRMGNTDTEIFDSEKVLEKYGVTPAEFVNVKAIMGDTSDNIPGVKGIGEKGALALISEFKNLENIYLNIDSDKITKSMRQKLIEGKETAFLSRTLATIDVDVPICFECIDAKVKQYDEESLFEIFTRLEFKSFLKKLSKTYIDEKQQKETVKTELKELDSSNTCEIMLNGEKTAYIIDSKNKRLYFAQKADTCYFIDINDETSNYIKEFFADEKIKKIAHSFKEDIIYLSKAGIEEFNNVFDTEIAAYLIEPSRKSYLIEELAFDFLGIVLLKNSESGAVQLSLEGEEEDKEYLHDFTAALLKLENYETEKLKQTEQEKLFYEIEMPLVFVLANMQMTGVLVNSEKLSEFGEMLTSKIDNLTKEIHALAEGEFNINSPKQLGEVLFERLKLKAVKKTKTGYSTNAETLEKLAGEHPIIEKILEYRQLTKLNSTYVVGLKNEINKETGRIHSNFNQTVTQTGRISSAEPNLQNIPVRTELGREMRKMFIAKEGFSLVGADYSQIELRVLAHIAGDKNMTDAFKSGKDIHSSTACRIFSCEEDDITPAMRTAAKAINFGLIYGKGEFSLAKDLNISMKEAKEYINDYLGSYPDVQKYMKDIVAFAHEKGYVTTMFGRRRVIAELASKNFQLRSFGERAALNTPIQGSAADIIKLAMVKVFNKLKENNLKSRLILQVHDELIVEAEDSEIEIVKDILKTEMENACTMAVPLKTDMQVGRSWYDTK
ncbi:MAG: DNA polymerase I [Ruminococcaceae bacterium]|nr:DNA polymerase I [Oscillospiraceae bacterium]